LKSWSDYRFNNRTCGWVPAFAGTTLNIALARIAPDISSINDGDVS
jgi:hypothetical protein